MVEHFDDDNVKVDGADDPRPVHREAGELREEPLEGLEACGLVKDVDVVVEEDEGAGGHLARLGGEALSMSMRTWTWAWSRGDARHVHLEVFGGGAEAEVAKQELRGKGGWQHLPY